MCCQPLVVLFGFSLMSLLFLSSCALHVFKSMADAKWGSALSKARIQRCCQIDATGAYYAFTGTEPNKKNHPKPLSSINPKNTRSRNLIVTASCCEWRHLRVAASDCR